MHYNRHSWQKVAWHIVHWLVIAVLVVGSPSTMLALPPSKETADALLARADVLMQQGKLRLARDLYARAVEQGAALDKDPARARNLGLAYLEGVPPELRLAARWLNTAWHLAPADQTLRYRLAQALAWSGEYDKAAEHFAALLAATPASRDYAFGLADALEWSGDPHGATAALGEFVNRVPADIPGRLRYAQLLAYSHQYADSMTQYQIILQADPLNLQAQVGIAKVLSWQNELPTALKLFNEILSRYPNQYEAQVGKAFTLLWLDRRAEARALFERLAAANPRDNDVLAALRSLQPQAIAISTGLSAGSTSLLASSQPPDALLLSLAPMAGAYPALVPVGIPNVRQAGSSERPNLSEADARAAQARGDLEAAARIYRQLLRHDLDNAKLRLQLARVLSWTKHYRESLAEYQRLEADSPDAPTPALEQARVLSWARDFDASVTGYRKLLARLQVQSAPELRSADVRLEMARVLGWSRKYDQAVEELDLVLASPDSPRIAALVEKGRVLSWSRQYGAALAAYDVALRLDPSNFDARLGRAQTLYWSGHSSEASVLLGSLLQQKPDDSSVRVTMAAVEYNSGHKGKALKLLDGTGQNGDADSLRHAIRQDLRPVMRLRFGYGDDQEIDHPGIGTSLRALRYTAAIEFSLHPDIRMEVSNTVTQGNTSNAVLGKYGPDALATSTMLRATLVPTRRLQMTIGAGEGTTGAIDFGSLRAARRHEFLFEIRPVFADGPIRLEGLITRRLADYTPLSVHDNVVEWREAFSAEYLWRQRVRLGTDYWHSDYSIAPPGEPALGTSADGGAVRITPVLYRGERLTVEAGGRYELFRFDNSASLLQEPVQGIGSAGFFAPRLLQRYAVTGHAAWSPVSRITVDLHGDYGPQRLFGFAKAPLPRSWARTANVGMQVSTLLRHWRPFVGVDYFTTGISASPAGLNASGSSYRSIAGSLGVAYRF